MKKIFFALLFFPVFLHAQAPSLFNVSAITTPATTGAIVGKYRALTVPNTAVTATITSFPMLVDTVLASFATVANGGMVQNASGYDIEFAADSAGNTPLSWDMESYNATTGAVVCWVNVPSISATAGAVIYVKYGIPGVTTYQGNRTGTWDVNFLSVWHFADVLTGSGQTMTDASSNARNASSQGTWTSGQTVAGVVGNCTQFLYANGDYATFTPTTMPASYTVELWCNATTMDNTTTPIGQILTTGIYGSDVNFYGDYAHLFNGPGGNDVCATQTTLGIPTNTWFHILFTVSGANCVAYYNGAQNNTTTTGSALIFQYFGRQASTISQNFKVDEMRLSGVARSAAYVAANYATQKSPNTFFSMGIEK